MGTPAHQVELLPKPVSGTMVKEPVDRFVYVQISTSLVVLRQYYLPDFRASYKDLRFIMVVVSSSINLMRQCSLGIDRM